MLTLGEAIKRLRTAAGHNQREFAALLEVDPSYLSHLEADRRTPSVQLLRRIATEASVPPGLLLAVAMWTDLPDGDREQYEPIISRLLTLGNASQMGLQLQ